MADGGEPFDDPINSAWRAGRLLALREAAETADQIADEHSAKCRASAKQGTDALVQAAMARGAGEVRSALRALIKRATGED